MATIRAYTTTEQSRKLVEILPIESADMCYLQENGQAKTISPLKLSEILNVSKPQVIPCWSLAALRNLLPVGIKINENTYLFGSHNTFDKSWVYRYYNEDDISYLYYKNISEINACYEMILKLHELNLL